MLLPHWRCVLRFDSSMRCTVAALVIRYAFGISKAGKDDGSIHPGDSDEVMDES